jgi:hypothetical protein
MDKRSELMKLVANADDKGIEKIYTTLYGDTIKLEGTDVSFDDFAHASAEILVEMSKETPKIMLLAPILAEYISGVFRKLEGKNDKKGTCK